MVIQGTRVFIGGLLMPAQIRIAGEKIDAVLPYGTETADMDFGDNIISPGFIDVHTHGAYGFDVDSADPEGLVRWLQKLPEEGVTGFLPTTTSQPTEVITRAMENIVEVQARRLPGAQILGAHAEGPMLDVKYRGAHATEKLQLPSIEEFERYQQAAKGQIKYLTLAIEHDPGFALTQHASRRGVTVSIGHSGASMDTAMLAIAHGASSFTHSFNGMSGLHHRTPGVLGAVMASNVFAEIIADGHHVLSNVVNILFKTHEKMLLISDSLLIKGLAPGRYNQGGQDIEVGTDGTARIADTNTLAGSSLRINRGVELLVKQAMVPLEQALLSATLYPAQVLGLEAVKGRICAGNDADITVLAEDFSVVQTFCLGRAVL